MDRSQVRSSSTSSSRAGGRRSLAILGVAVLLVVTVEAVARVAAPPSTQPVDQLVAPPTDGSVWLLGNSIVDTGVDETDLSERLGVPIDFEYHGARYTDLWYLITRNALPDAGERPAVVIWGFRPHTASFPALRFVGAVDVEAFEVSSDAEFERLAQPDRTDPWLGGRISGRAGDLVRESAVWAGRDTASRQLDDFTVDMAIALLEPLAGGTSELLENQVKQGDSSLADVMVFLSTDGAVSDTEELVDDLAAEHQTGLATASKLTGALVGPPVVIAVLAYRPVRRTVEQATAATGIALGTWAATYLPFGRTANEAVQYLWDNQTGHLQAGHTQYVAGRVYDKPPWWTPFWHQVDAVGWPLALTLGLLVGASLVRWRDRPVAMMLAVAVFLIAALCIAPVKLRHYRYVALPVLYVLAAIGGSELWRRKSALPRVVLGAALAVVVASSAIAVVNRLTIEPSDYAAVPAELATVGLVDADVHVFGAPHLQRLYLPDDQVVSGAGPDGMASTSVIVIDRNWEKRNPEVPVGDFLGTRTSIDLGAVVLWVPA